jgi:molybdopterin synthase sulfur carrier subunit
MRVTVRLFARLRDLVGTPELAREVTEPATVASVWNALISDYPAARDYERAMSVAVNATYARMHSPVNKDDEVAFLPPVSGG